MLIIAGGIVLGWLGIHLVRAVIDELLFAPRVLPPPAPLTPDQLRVTDPELRRQYGLPPLDE